MKVLGKIALAGVSLLAVAAPAFAQDVAAKDTDEAGLGSEEIVVAARRRDESAQDVPLVVNAVTAESINKLNIREFQDVQSLVPGLALNNPANGIGAQASLRGVAFDVNSSGNNGTIEFYMNDAPLSAGILFQSMFDVGQIEVLRGPQGTLRGRASPSGSITVTTRRPVLSEAGGYVTGTVNDIGGWNLNGAINIPVVQDVLAIRLAGVIDEGEGNRVHSINNALDPYVQTHGGRISVAAEPVEWLSLFGSYTRTQREALQYDQVESLTESTSGAAASPTLITASDRKAVEYAPRRYTQDFKVWNWQAQVRFAGQKLDYVGSHNEQSFVSADPNDKGAFFGAAYPEAVRTAAQVTNTGAKQTTHELRLSNDDRVFGVFDYVIGGLINKLDSPTSLATQRTLFLGFVPAGMTHTPTPQALAPAALGGPVANVPVERGGDTKEQSLFGNVTAHITDATEISAGIRFINYQNTGFLTVSGVPVPAANEDGETNKTIWSASVKHRFTPDLMVYASYGSSWRPGSSTNPIILRDLVNPGALLQSFYFPGDESSDSFELGLKSEWLDGRLKFNITAYYQDFENYAYSSPNVYVAGQARTRDGSLINQVFLAEPALAVGVPADVKGVEADMSFRVTDNWDLGATVSYSKSKIKDGVIPCNNYGGQVPTYDQILAANNGQQVATCTVDYSAGITPPFVATFQTEYTHPFSDSIEGYVRGLMNFYGNSDNDPANIYDDVESYALINLFAGVRGSDGLWEIGAYAKNLFDVERVLSRTAAPYGVPYTVICDPRIPGLGAACPGGTVTSGQTGQSTYRGITMTAPQEFGLTATIRFGSR